MPSVVRFDVAQLQPEEYFVAAERLIVGNPRQTVWLQYSDPGAKFSAGYWQSEPGKWGVVYTEEEYCQLLEGVSIVTDAAGTAVTLKPGDSFIVPKGFTGTWEVVEKTRKIFVIYEPGA